MLYPPDAATRAAGSHLPGGGGIEVRLFGGFGLLKHDGPIVVRAGGKTEGLLLALALRLVAGVERQELLAQLWPSSDEALAAQSLDALIHALRRSVGNAMAGASPIVRIGGRLRLNTELGVRVDVAEFEANIARGDGLRRLGRAADAVPFYEAAADLYRGDLTIGSDIRHLLERERLRSRYLELLRELAEMRFAVGMLHDAREWARRLLECDPCREDAHRLVMRCDVRQGQRAQALRQFRTCEAILRREFDVEPEPATRDLFETIRLSPASI